MSQKLSNEEHEAAPSWEEAITRYLEDHPDYFEQHPALLLRLRLAHPVEGRAVSLIERQVQVLRDQLHDQTRQLNELLAVARENDLSGNRLHRFALAMLDAGSLDAVLDTAADLLRQEFRLDAATILVHGEAAGREGRSEIVAADDRRLLALLKPLHGGKPLCGVRLDDSLKHYLFAGQAAEIRSAALVPLGNTQPRGVLALGSRDRNRFHAGMGTVYLSRLGDLLLHGLAHHGL